MRLRAELGRSARRRRGGAGAAAAALLAAAACAGSPLRPEDLRARHPQLGPDGARHLAELLPHVLPAEGVLTLFLCRWTTEAPIPVSLPPEASAGERASLRAALRDWEAAGLGLRFVEVDAGASLMVRFVPGGRAADGPTAGSALADCRLAPSALAAQTAEVLSAELVAARIEIPRPAPPDGAGRDRPLGPQETRAAARAELGRALGLASRPRPGRGGSAADFAEEVERAAALYALPSGTVLRRLPLAPSRTDLLDRMARLAAESEGVEGPFVRLGGAAARVFWRDARGREYGFQVGPLPRALGEPGALWLLPEARTRRALPRRDEAAD